VELSTKSIDKKPTFRFTASCGVDGAEGQPLRPRESGWNIKAKIKRAGCNVAFAVAISQQRKSKIELIKT